MVYLPQYNVIFVLQYEVALKRVQIEMKKADDAYEASKLLKPLPMATGREVQHPIYADFTHPQAAVVTDGPPSIADDASEHDSGTGTILLPGEEKLEPLDCPKCYKKCANKKYFDDHVKKC